MPCALPPELPWATTPYRIKDGAHKGRERSLTIAISWPPWRGMCQDSLRCPGSLVPHHHFGAIRSRFFQARPRSGRKAEKGLGPTPRPCKPRGPGVQRGSSRIHFPQLLHELTALVGPRSRIDHVHWLNLTQLACALGSTDQCNALPTTCVSGLHRVNDGPQHYHSSKWNPV